MLRRRVLLTATGLLLATETVTAQESETDCSYIEITDEQIDNVISESNDYELLKEIQAGSAEINYIYLGIDGEDEYSYDNGEIVKFPSSSKNLDAVLTIDRLSQNDPNNTYANTKGFMENVNCDEIPFSREPEAQFEYSPQDPSEDDNVVLDASATTVEAGSVQTYRWEVNDDTLSETGKVVRTTLDSGVNTVTLTVIMESDITQTATDTIEVGSVASLSPSFKYDTANPTTEDTVAFDASGTTVENADIQAYEWDFDDDGTTDATGVNAVKQFDVGKHVVSLTVRDTQGNEETTEQVLRVDPKRVNVSITASDTEVKVGGETIIQYSVNNFLSSEELTTQLLVETPSDVNVTGVSGAQGSNQYTAEETVPPGEQQSMRVTLQVNAVGQHEITAIAEYLTTGEQAIDERASKELLITAVDGTPEKESTDGTETEDESPGFGIGGGLTAIAGAGYMLKNRLTNDDD